MKRNPLFFAIAVVSIREYVLVIYQSTIDSSVFTGEIDAEGDEFQDQSFKTAGAVLDHALKCLIDC